MHQPKVEFNTKIHEPKAKMQSRIKNLHRERERERESFYLFVWAKYGLNENENENRKFLEEAQVKE